MSELGEKIARLPAWAREHIAYLRGLPEQLQRDASIARDALESQKKLNKKLKNRCEIMTEIFSAASRAENETAKEYVARMFAEYGDETE